MFNITREFIKSNCSIFAFDRGMEYHFSKRIRTIQYNPKKNMFVAAVLDIKERNVSLAFDAAGHLADFQCSCKLSRNSQNFCEHMVALLLLIEERDNAGFFDELIDREKAKRIFEIFSYEETERKMPVRIEPTLLYSGPVHVAGKINTQLYFRIGIDHSYIVKDLKSFLMHVDIKRSMQFSKRFTFDPSKHCFSEKDNLLIDFLLEIYEAESEMFAEYENSGAGSSSAVSRYLTKAEVFRDKYLRLTDRQLGRFLDIYAKSGRPLHVEIGTFFNGKSYVIDRDFKLDFKLIKDEMDFVLKIDIDNILLPLTKKSDILFYKGTIYKLPKNRVDLLKPLIEVLDAYKEKEFRFISEDRGRFVSEVLPVIDMIGTLQIDEDVTSLIDRRELETEIYLDKEEGAVTADVRFQYGDLIINPFAPVKKETNTADSNDGSNHNHNNNSIIVRDVKKEADILDILAEADFKVKNNKVNLYDDDSIYSFVVDILPRLQTYAHVYYTDQFKNVSVRRGVGFKIKMSLGGNSNGSDLLQFEFDADFIDRSELLAILEGIREKKRYYKLKDGSLLNLGEKEVTDIVSLMEFLEADEEDIRNGHITLPSYRALYIDYYLRNSSIRNVKRDKIFKEFVRSINEPVENEFCIPANMDASLRDYQKVGFKWLKTLSCYSLGGILADDMGLGKTVQILTLLLSEKEAAGNGKHSASTGVLALVVVPTSLVYNWCAEIEKFTPSLKYIAITGNKTERVKLIENVSDFDVVITSYPLIRRDYEEYRKTRFQYCILDEAQHIKNPNSQNALSVKCLNSMYRFALTGTPMENRLIELWSIFDFVLPGYLYSAKGFSERYAQPIAEQQESLKSEDLRAADNEETQTDDSALQTVDGEPRDADRESRESNGTQHDTDRTMQAVVQAQKTTREGLLSANQAIGELSGQIRPFILRRLKVDVLQELPEKIDTKMYAEMTIEQKKLYFVYLKKIKQEIEQEIHEHGFEKSQIMILAALTRLRQLCCHPSLFIENYEHDCGKFLLVQEIIRDAIDGGHRILLFSQFTSMLALIRKWANEEKIHYKYLDGQVRAFERHKMINEFNEGDGELFLLSLKAGGTGLNLTGADTVIHYDPWWNPAVEDQATDRAYRIGQQKTVQVIKLLTAGSIEEKIFAIQERKKQLIDAVIKPGETFLTKLSKSDLEEILSYHEP